MADGNKEKNEVIGTNEKAADMSVETVEAAPENKNLDGVLEELGHEVEKGKTILREQGKKNKHVLEAVDAAPPEKKEGEIDESNIMGKANEAAKTYEGEISALINEEKIEVLQKNIPNVEDKIEGIKKERGAEINKRNPIEIIYIDKDGLEKTASEQQKEGIRKAIDIINEENNYYRKFFKGKDVISKAEFNESKDNYFAYDEEKAVDVPLKNPENLEETAPILRHEAFHEALRMRSGEWEQNAKEKMTENIREGKDTNLEELGLNIETGKFKKFVEDKREKRSVFATVDMHYGRINQTSHFEEEIEEIIEEKLADEMMLKREKEENPDKAIENVIKAKTISLDNIAKNKGLDRYEDMNSFSRAGFKEFIANFYNTYRFLSRISAEGGNQEESEKFAQIAEKCRKNMEDKISNMFEKKEWGDAMKESYGYTKEELLSDINDLLEKFD